jgi:heme o synthase
MASSKFRAYYVLAKPGIIYGNALTVVAGYLFASGLHVHFETLASVLLGTSLVIGSACVFNNYIDRDIDKHMARTQSRALVLGAIRPRNALLYGALLGLFGFSILALWTNWLVVTIGVVGFVDYVILYAISKRRWSSGTLVGSISGATPIIAGYCAFTGTIDVSAILIFTLMVIWQMPHFYAIALYRKTDYASAKVPVLPVKKGNVRTVTSIVAYCSAYIVALLCLTLFGNAGYSFLIIMLPLSIWWLTLAFKGYPAKGNADWARMMFLKSLIFLCVFSVMVALAQILP